MTTSPKPRLVTVILDRSIRLAQAKAARAFAAARERDHGKPFPDPCDETAARTLIGFAVASLPHARRAELLRELARLLEFADETPAGGVS